MYFLSPSGPLLLNKSHFISIQVSLSLHIPNLLTHHTRKCACVFLDLTLMSMVMVYMESILRGGTLGEDWTMGAYS